MPPDAGAGSVGLMDRGSNKHGPNLDDEMAREVRGYVQGAGAGGRVEEWREAEPSGEDEPEVGANPDLVGEDEPGGPEGAPADVRDAELREARSRIGRYLPRSVLPADRERLIAAAEADQAPDDVLDELRRLDAGTTYATVEQIWVALGHEPDRRF